MPITSSAKKKMRSSLYSRTVNRMRKGQIRSSEKAFKKQIAAGNIAEATTAFKEAQSYIARGVKWGVVHLNRASARTAKMSAMLRAVNQQSR